MRYLRDASIVAVVDDGTIRLEGETADHPDFLDGQLLRTGPIVAGFGTFETDKYIYVVNEDYEKESESESPESGLPEQSGT